MDNFNFNRFVRTCKWCFYEQSAKLLKWTTASLIVTLAVELFFVTIFRKMTPGDMPDMRSTYQMGVMTSCGICSAFVLIAIMFAFSNIFAWLKNKQKRIAFLMLPATNLEQWIAAVVFALIVFPVCISLGYVVGDYARCGIFYAMGEEWLPGTNFLFKVLGIKNSVSGFDVCGFALTVWGASCFILAGTWLRKGQFVIPTVFYIVLMALLGYLAKNYHNEIAEMIVNGISNGYSSVMRYSVATFFFLVALFNYWLSYRLFTRFQIITSKWTNL